MLEVVIVDSLPIGFFSKQSLDALFYWSSQANHKNFKIENSNLDTLSKNRSNCTSLHFTLQIFDDSINLFRGEREDTSIGGENGEIPYNPIYLTSRTICQPKMHLPLQDFERELLEHQ